MHEGTYGFNFSQVTFNTFPSFAWRTMYIKLALYSCDTPTGTLRLQLKTLRQNGSNANIVSINTLSPTRPFWAGNFGPYYPTNLVVGTGVGMNNWFNRGSGSFTLKCSFFVHPDPNYTNIIVGDGYDLASI